MVEPEGTRAFLSVLKPGQIVFDIGANIGYYTLVASRRVGPSGKVLAFAPFARNISYLFRHVELNRADNVTVIPTGCSGRTARALFAAGSNCATGRLVDVPTRSLGTRFDYVATVTVDQIVRESGLVPTVLKIDVEGAEEQVLTGAAETLSTARPISLLSVHSDLLRSSCTTYLRRRGYAEPVVCSEPYGEAELLFVPRTDESGVGSGEQG